MKYGLWAQLSTAIVQMSCACTENDACKAHELLDELFDQVSAPSPAA